ncbi:hypothetical protein LOAG_14852 [Loa loa]|uniref:Uncharacterized protein n=1 Tax=Loa loa TaxID=7209 RepID=A0A1S0TIA2_LOALO|nr:hypothetical protein LOAG_14852 [Loa loa]EFO13676.1 hypothetical protein LOAG_14852 [Loa loa]
MKKIKFFSKIRSEKKFPASSSSKSKVSLASTGSSAAIPRSPSSHKSDVQLAVLKDEDENTLKWKHCTKYIYEAEHISIKLKEIAAECEKDIELRVAMDDIVTKIDV